MPDLNIFKDINPTVFKEVSLEERMLTNLFKYSESSVTRLTKYYCFLLVMSPLRSLSPEKIQFLVGAGLGPYP